MANLLQYNIVDTTLLVLRCLINVSKWKSQVSDRVMGWDKLLGTDVSTALKIAQRPTPFHTRHYITYMRNLIQLHQQRGGLAKHEPEYLV